MIQPPDEDTPDLDKNEVISEPTNIEILKEAHKLTDDLDKKTSHQQDKVIIAVCIVCIIQILLVFGVIVAVTQNQNVQSVVNKEVLCPLYETFKSSESVAARNASTNKIAYDQLVQNIDHGISVLGCTHS